MAPPSPARPPPRSLDAALQPGSAASRPLGSLYPKSAPGFTLIEMMVVVGIMGIVMTMAMPAIYRQLHPESMQKAVTDIMEACSHARAQAILNHTVTELRIRPFDRTLSVANASGVPLDGGDGGAWRQTGGEAHAAGGGGSFSARISDQILIEMIDVNFFDFTEEEMAQIRFYPNGTSDEFTIVLNNDKREWRMIRLEVVTGIPDYYTDPQDPRITHLLR